MTIGTRNRGTPEQNARAIKLYRSEGFTCEGLHRENLKKGENFLSLKVMSILVPEYKASADTLKQKK